MSATPVSIRLNSATYNALCALSKERKRTVHWLMTDAVQRYAERESRRDAFRRQTLEAWEEYAETGLHVTLDEVTDWVDSWGTDHEKTMPVCHV